MFFHYYALQLAQRTGALCSLNEKLNQNQPGLTCMHLFTRVSCQLQVFSSSFDSFTVFSVSLVIILSNNFSFSFRKIALHGNMTAINITIRIFFTIKAENGVVQYMLGNL